MGQVWEARRSRSQCEAMYQNKPNLGQTVYIMIQVEQTLLYTSIFGILLTLSYKIKLETEVIDLLIQS